MLRASEIAGFIGVGLAGVAYIPQIWHLVREHCAAGISRFAFSLWLGATILVTTNAIAGGATVFIVLGGVQLTATALILLYATKYRSTYCASHVPVDVSVAAEPALFDDEMGADEPDRFAAASLGRG